MRKLFALFALSFVCCGQVGADSDLLKDLDMQSLQDKDVRFTGFELIHKGKLNEAVSFCDEVLKIKPHNPEAYFQKGLAFAQLKNWKAAVNSMTFAIEYNRSPLPEVYYERGQSFEELGKLEEALSDYEKAIELGFDYRDVYFLRDGVMIKLGIDMSK